MSIPANFFTFSLSPVALLLAFVLDLGIGDPQWLPHPVRIIGKAINHTEIFLRKYCKTPAAEKSAGIILTGFIVSMALIATLVIQYLIFFSAYRLQYYMVAFFIYLISSTIAVRELIGSAWAVIKAVKENSLDSARSRLGLIVGRDTKELSEHKILTATIETLAENLSDGIIAPLFYLALGGLPAAMAYKAVNTLDSMVGYKNERYINFGWASAKLDDIANYIPARISGWLIVVSILLLDLFKNIRNAYHSAAIMFRDGRNHLSPNSGVPEAAMAGALGVRLGGPSTYGGVLVEKLYIGDDKVNDYLYAANHAMRVAGIASVLGAALAATVLYIRVYSL